MNVRIPIRVFIEIVEDRGWGLIVLYPLSQTIISQRFNDNNILANIENVIIYSLNRKIQNSIKAIQINFVKEEIDLNQQQIEQGLKQLEITWIDIKPSSKLSHKAFETIANKVKFISQAA